MRRLPLVVPVVIVVASSALVFVFVLDDGDEKASHFGGIPVAAAAVRTEGTALRSGFSVARGTALVGEPFPNTVVFLGTHNGVPIPDPGWSANLLVTGDPRRVMSAYRDQAITAGFAMEPARCGYDDRDGARLYSCEMAGSGNSPDDHRSLWIWLMRGDAPFGAMSHMKIDYHGNEATSRIAGSPESGVHAPTPGPSSPPLPTNWEQLARPGDFVFGESAKAPLSYMPPAFKVQPGSEVAAPIGPAGPCCTYDWAVILRVTGDPAEIAGAYRAQLNARSKTFGKVGTVVESAPVKGTTMYEFIADYTGGWDYYFEVMHGPHGNWMRVRAEAQT